MLIFGASRPWGAAALYYASIYWGVLLWVQSCIYVLGALGPVWFIVGVLLAGIGVVPIAWVGTLVHGDWTNWKWLSLDLVWVFGTRLLAIRCSMERAKRAWCWRGRWREGRLRALPVPEEGKYTPRRFFVFCLTVTAACLRPGSALLRRFCYSASIRKRGTITPNGRSASRVQGRKDPTATDRTTGGWMADFTLIEDIESETIVRPYYGQRTFPTREDAISAALESARREINKAH